MKKYIKLLRPKQWIKNVLVFAALFFSANLFNISIMIDALIVFVLFCMLSSATYILNDIQDKDKDSKHPKKCLRPIASGEVSIFKARIIMIFLLTCSFSSAMFVSNLLFSVFVSYFVMNILYSFKLKHEPILDVMIIAIGFVLRTLAGAIVVDVQISPWLILCTFLLSLFLALNKRKSEIQTIGSSVGETRKVLEFYTEEMLNEMLSTIVSSIFIAYCLYTFFSDQPDTMILTIPLVLYGIFRYQYLSHTTEMMETPELVLFYDKPLLLTICIWVLTCGAIIYI